LVPVSLAQVQSESEPVATPVEERWVKIWVPFVFIGPQGPSPPYPSYYYVMRNYYKTGEVKDTKIRSAWLKGKLGRYTYDDNPDDPDATKYCIARYFCGCDASSLTYRDHVIPSSIKPAKVQISFGHVTARNEVSLSLDVHSASYGNTFDVDEDWDNYGELLTTIQDRWVTHWHPGWSFFNYEPPLDFLPVSWLNMGGISQLCLKMPDENTDDNSMRGDVTNPHIYAWFREEELEELFDEIPVASFDYSPKNPLVGEEITFDAYSSYDLNGEIVSYSWDFGDGNSAISEMVTHTYTETGEYTVNLIVKDNDGLTDFTQKNILVSPIAITHVSTIWQDEIDEMVVPYDLVELNFTFKNNHPAALHNVKLLFKNNTDLISFENGNIDIGKIAPGEFSVINSIIVAGVDNKTIMDKIVNVGGGKLFLNESINVTVEYDSGSEKFPKLTPTDGNNNPLYIQYPNFKPIVGDPDPNDDEDNYYMKGDDQLSHTEHELVRKYAVIGAATDPDTKSISIFPDNPKDVSFNVFRYVDDKLDPDEAQCLFENDIEIVKLLDDLDGHDDLPGPWICIAQALLLTSFERTLGFPSREVNVAEGSPKGAGTVRFFTWDEIPGNDVRFKMLFLKQVIEIDRAESAKIEKTDNGMTIKVSTEHNSLSLKLNDEKTSVTLTMGDGSTKEYIVKEKDGELEVYNSEPMMKYWQNYAAEVWYDGKWNFYDPFNSATKSNIVNYDDLKKICVKFIAWNAFDKRDSFDKYWGSVTHDEYVTHNEYKGHNYMIEDYTGNPEATEEWDLRACYDKDLGFLVIVDCPVEMHIIDNQGRMVGSTDTGIVNEIPGAKYLPPGQIAYSNWGDVLELSEFIFLPDELEGDFELIVKGTGDGEYQLQFAKFDPSAADEYSDVITFTYTIKEDEIHSYQVSIDETTLTVDAEDTIPPTIVSVTLDAYTTIPDATIHVTVNATDNAGVTSVAADGAPLDETGSTWEGVITALSTTGDYTLTIRAEDDAGNFDETTVEYSVVIPTGGLGVGIQPKISSAPAGSTLPLDIKIVSTANFDDVLHVYLTLDGIPTDYQADLSWFDWTDTTVQASAGGEVVLPIVVNIPDGVSSGYKSFGVKVESTKWSSDAQDYGAIMIT
jgi:PKD repeat protein